MSDTRVVEPEEESGGPVVKPARETARRVYGWIKERQLVLGAFVASRLVILLTVVASGWVKGDTLSFLERTLDTLGSWDSAHYRHIARLGYSASTAVVEGTREIERLAFFPLWPMLQRYADVILPVGLPATSLILANLFALAGILWLRALLIRETSSVEIADRASIYMLIFPAAYVWAMGYGDSLFFLISVAFFDLIRRGKWEWAAVVGVLGGLARPQGLVLSLAAALVAIPILYTKLRAKEPVRRWLPAFARPSLSAAGPVIGVAIYLLYIHLEFGDFRLVVEQQWQPYWKQEPSFFLWSAASKFMSVFTLGLNENVVLAIFIFAAFAAAIYAFKVLPLPYAAYAMVALAASTSTKNIVVADRYILLLFPLFWAVALIGKRKWFDGGYRVFAPVLMGTLALLAWTGAWVP